MVAIAETAKLIMKKPTSVIALPPEQQEVGICAVCQANVTLTHHDPELGTNAGVGMCCAKALEFADQTLRVCNFLRP